MSAKNQLVPKELEEDLKPKGDQQQEEETHHNTSLFISDMEPLTKEAYGGGMYGHDDDDTEQPENTERKPASDTQSADGPVGPVVEPKHKPPPSTGDRDIDITGQSYIQ
ncbi:Mediator of RNA polymerase II transcription subunit 26 [Heracleum sosnowskyi]|uniref:Mediator of RNA polymerase II transcription subunit 26 n=1 Tax=Heracleum sosnowskyi TaxID=360622 RepID=A0AAD8IMW8_9APIA|nr:Mediator of RNA polymerase II transcription subunit 26 [Heracleum sosnowskyi]